jgi:WD40 repeat protein
MLKKSLVLILSVLLVGCFVSQENTQDNSVSPKQPAISKPTSVTEIEPSKKVEVLKSSPKKTQDNSVPSTQPAIVSEPARFPEVQQLKQENTQDNSVSPKQPAISKPTSVTEIEPSKKVEVLKSSPKKTKDNAVPLTQPIIVSESASFPETQPLKTVDNHPSQLLPSTSSSIKPQLVKQTGHFLVGSIPSASFSADGKTIISNDIWITKLWDVATGREIRSFPEINFPVIFLPDSNIIVSDDLELWDIATGNKISTFEENEKNVDFMLLSPDGNTILVGNTFYPGKVSEEDLFHQKTSFTLWDITSRKRRDTFKATVENVKAVTFSQDGRKVLLFVVSHEPPLFYGIKYLDVSTGQEIQFNKIMNKELPDMAIFSPNGRFLLIGNSDGSLILKDTETLQEIHSFQKPLVKKPHFLFQSPESIAAIAFSSDSKIALSFDYENNIKLWDVATGNKIHSFQVSLLWSENNYKMMPGTSTPTIIFPPDGHTILLTDYDIMKRNGIFHLFDTKTGQKINSFYRRSDKIKAIKFSPNDQIIWSSNEENTLKVWNIKNGNQTSLFPGKTTNVLSAAISNDGNTILSLSQSWQQPLWIDTPQPFNKQITKTVKLENVKTGHEIFSFDIKGTDLGVISNIVTFSPDTKTALFKSDKAFQVWNVETGKQIFFFRSKAPLTFVNPTKTPSVVVNPIKEILYSPDSKTILSVHHEILRLWDVKTGHGIRSFQENIAGTGDIIFSLDGHTILSSRFDLEQSNDGTLYEIKLWNVKTGKELRSLKYKEWENKVPHYEIELWDAKKGQKTYSFNEDDLNNEKKLIVLEKQTLNSFLKGITFFPKNGLSCHFSFIRLGKNRKIPLFENFILEEETKILNCHDFNFSPDKDIATSIHEDGNIQIWDAQTGQKIAQLVSFLNNKWAVVAPDGRYDTSTPGDIPGISWVMPDDPLTPLPVEIFMKEYFEPRLLHRLIKGESLPPIKSVAELNRVQPKIEIVQITPNPDNPALVSVTVKVAGNQKDFQRNGKTITQTTGVHDLRLFREGQLVAYAPKTSGEIELDPVTNYKKLTFKYIRLARKENIKQVEFSAYAFNDDGVKSATARKTYTLPENLKPVKGKVYLITIGVNAYENPAWDLYFAANDARIIQSVLSQKIAESQSNNYSDIIPITLISEYQYQQGQRVITNNQATKQIIQALFNKLSGQSIDSRLLAGIPNADKLQTAQPEDMLLLSFSSHGHADNKGNFYLFPYDIGTGTNKDITESLLSHTISSEELSLWLRDVDAGDMVMIIDACHSAASVEGEGFKPGPMGSRGLGQLAYDKGMRILTASQADDIALEHDDLEHGFLTYSLIQEGIQASKADWKPKDLQIMLGEWLQYGEKRVPELYAEVRNGNLKTYNRGTVIRQKKEQGTSSRLGQQPSLFDFTKRKEDVVVVRMRQ